MKSGKGARIGVATAVCGREFRRRRPQAFQFSDFEWEEKHSGSAQVGPGPNRFRRENVSVGADGLHLFIRRDPDGRWSCAEVVLKQSLGYGRYTWEIATPVDALQIPELVLGLFTWSNPSPNNEMDVEIAHFAGAYGPNLFHSVQPNTKTAAIAGPEWDASEHAFVWAPRYVEHTSTPLGDGAQDIDPIFSRFRRGIPRPSPSTTPRINFWLRGGSAPSVPQVISEIEIVVSAFSFEPLGSFMKNLG